MCRHPVARLGLALRCKGILEERCAKVGEFFREMQVHKFNSQGGREIAKLGGLKRKKKTGSSAVLL